MPSQVTSSREFQHARYALVLSLLSDREQTWSAGNTGKSHSTFILILNDKTLLKIFYLCRLVVSDEDEVDDNHILERTKWNGEQWWYNIAHVCRRWRYLVLESASFLDLCLICTYGTPVADVLAHSPPLPLIIDYGDEDRELTTQVEERILLAFQRRRRVRHIRLCIPSSNLRKLAVAIDGEFPALEYLCIKSSNNDDSSYSSLILPETFKAPRLRHFALRNATDCPGAIRFPPPTHRFQSIDTIGQCSRRCGIQFRRYVPFSYVYQLLGEQGPFSTGHSEYLFISSTMIHFSRYSISVSRYF